MVAFADADFPLNTNKGSDKWVSDGGTQKEITEDNVISSPGAHVTTQVTLCPGKYSFSVGEGSDNARLVLAHKQDWSSTDDGVITDKSKIDGIKATVADAASKTYTYEVTKEMTVWLRVCCVTDNKAFTAKGAKMTLVYDFEAEALKLDNEAVFNLGKVDKTKYPEVAEKLENEATRIKGLILEMKQQQNAEGAYNYYKKHQLWNGVESLQVWKDIQKLKQDIDDAANVTAVYAYAKTNHDAISDKLAGVDFQENAYAKAKYNENLTVLSNSFKTDFAGIEEYQTDAEYTTKFSKKNVDALVTKYEKEITALQKNINAAIADDEAYKAIVPKVNAVKKAYLEKQKELTGLMNANEGQKENVYEGLLQKATVELADANRMVTDTDFANKLGNKESHDNAAENQKNLEETVAAAQAKINATVEDYTIWYNAEVAAYANQKEVIAGKRGQLKLTYEQNADIDALKTAASDAITAFETEINKQNSAEGNWDLHNYVNSEAYNAQLATIDSKIKAFADKVGVDATNFANYTTLQNTITDLNKKLAEAKTAVAKMAYDKDGYKYNAVDQNNTLAIDGTEKGKEGSLTKAKAYVGKEYNAKTTYDLSKVDQAAIAGQIASYQSIAQASFDAYKEIVGNLAADKKAAAELKTLVGDEGYITNAAGKTYDAVVAEVEKNIADAAKPLAEALKKQNAEHQKALEGIYTSQKDAIAAHKTQFATDKAEYIKNTNIKDATQLRDAAQDVVKGINGTVAELEKKIVGAGTKKDAFTKELEGVKQEVAKHQGVLDSYKVIDEKNSLEAAAELGKVQKATAELQNQLAKLEKKVDAQLAVVKAEQDFLKGLRANDGELGKLQATIEKIKATNKDASRNAEFEGLYNEVNALYVALDKEAEDSCNIEKLQARWIEYYQDKKDDKGKAIRGLKGRCMDIQATADKHVEAAQASTKNWNAYNEVNKLIDDLKFDKSIADARDQITNGVVVPGQKDKQEITGEAQTFYLAEIVKFEESLKELKEQIETSYADPKREMADKQATYAKSLNDLSTSINTLPGKAAANEKANNELVKKSADIEKKLNEVITYVSENDKTSMRDVYLQQLTAQQKDLINEDKAVASEWAKGLLGENEQKHDAAYNAINKEILNIEAKQKGDYSEVVNAENQAYFDKFQAEYTKALNVHKQAVAKIEKYFNLEHEVLRNAVRENAKAHEVEIYNEMQLAKDLKAKFETEYSKKDPALVFEFPEETSFKTLQGHLTKIQGFTDALQADAEKDAKNDRIIMIENARTILSYERNELKTKYGFETYATAYADVEVQIKAAEDFEVTEAQDFVIELDGTKHIDNLKNAYDVIDAGGDAAAETEWKHFLATTDKKDVTKQDNMDKWAQAVGYYNEHDVLVPGSFEYPEDKATQHANDSWNMGQAYIYFNNYVSYGNPGLYNIVEYKGEVTKAYEGAKGIYDEASKLVVNREKSDAAYDELINGSKDFKNNHTALMAQLAHLNEYAAVYAISMDTPWSNQIDALTGNLYHAYYALKSAKKSATVHNVLDTYKEEFNAYAKQLDKTQKELASKYTIADTYQEEALAADLVNLKKEINKAVANSSYTIEHFDALRERLAQYNTDFEAAKKLAGYQAPAKGKAEAWPKHEAFATLQVKIAADLQEVRGSYTDNNDFADINADFEQRIAKLTELSNKLSGLVASDATHQQVKDKYRSQSESIKAELDEVKAYVDAHRDANGKILYYYNANVEKLIVDAERRDYTDVIYAQRVINNLNRDERAYDNHEARYAAVREDLVDANDHFNTVTWEEISNYQHKNPYYELQKAQIAEKVTAELEWLDANKTGNNSSIFTYRGLNNGIRTAMMNLQRAAAIAETDYLYNQEGMDLLDNLYYALFDSQFTEADCKEYVALYDSLTTAYGNMSTYNEQLKTNWVNVDINGNEHVDYWGDDVYEPYMQFGADEHNYQAVHAKAKELNQKVNDLLEVVAANRINPGDLNNDGAIDATDYVIVLNYVKGKPFSEDARQAEREFMRADVNGDGNKQINIGDLVKINNLVRGVDNRVMLLAQPLSLHARQVDNITLAAEGEGVNKRIAISLNNSVNYVGCQMDILLPEGVTLVSESVADRASNHEIYSSELENGAHRVIVASQNNDEFMGAEGAVIYLDVQVGHSYNGEGIQVSNVMFADPGSQVYHLNSLMGDEVTGIGTVTMTEELKSKVYNVGGQLLNGLKKGVNIIKMQDGTVKKIFKK